MQVFYPSTKRHPKQASILGSFYTRNIKQVFAHFRVFDTLKQVMFFFFC